MTTHQPTPHGAPRQRGNLPLGILLGVIVGAIAVMFAWFALVDDPDTATPGPTPAQTVESSQAPDPSPTPDESPVASPTPAESEAPQPSADASAPPDPEATNPPIPGITTELPAGSWVTVLDSPAKSGMTPEQAIARAAELSRPEHQAIVLDTDAFDGLNHGYWAIAIPGAQSRAASNEICRAIGIPVGDKCYPREIKGPR